MKRAIVVGILTLIFWSTSFAQEAGTAQDLYDRCVRNDPMCAPYLMGIASVMVILGKTYQDTSLEYRFVGLFSVFAVCLNGSPMTGHTLPHVFIAWLDRHPGRKHDFMASSAMDAFREAWPCNKSN